MKNVNMQVQGDTLTITIDLSARHGFSKSGKTEIVATTSGNAKVPEHDDMRIGLNVYTK